MKKCMNLLLCFALAFSLTACRGSVAPSGKPLVRVITRIIVSRDSETRVYSSDDSMKAILAYLRHLDPHTKAETAPTTGSIYRIRLIYSDGSMKDYHQRGLCFREENGPWETISEQDTLNLNKLFHLLEPDPTPSAI